MLRQFGSPEGVFRASKRDLEACHLPSEAAEAVLKRKAFPRAEKELAAVGKIDGCSLVSWTEPEYPQTLLQIYDPPIMLYVRGVEEPVPIDDLVERSGLNSSEVLATLLTLEMKGIVRQLPGKQFCKVLL